MLTPKGVLSVAPRKCAPPTGLTLGIVRLTSAPPVEVLDRPPLSETFRVAVSAL